ncbi:MAG: hypothetical protein VW715_12495 [Rhodospirillales bacterium]
MNLKKYEGHTKGPWTAEYGDYTTHVTNSDGVVVASVGFELDKDGQLIADAPLLLEEVKRLRKRIRDIIEEMQTWTEDQVGKPLFKSFIDELKEVIE